MSVSRGGKNAPGDKYLQTDVAWWCSAWDWLNPGSDNNFDKSEQTGNDSSMGVYNHEFNVPDKHAVELYGITYNYGDLGEYGNSGYHYIESWAYNGRAEDPEDGWHNRTNREDLIGYSAAENAFNGTDGFGSIAVHNEQIWFPEPVLTLEVGFEVEGDDPNNAEKGEATALLHYDIVGPLEDQDYMELLMER